MKLIKLTSVDTSKEFYINEKHLISFTKEGIGSYITSNDSFYGYVKETPLQILDMMYENERNTMDALGEMWEKERMKEAKESGQL